MAPKLFAIFDRKFVTSLDMIGTLPTTNFKTKSKSKSIVKDGTEGKEPKEIQPIEGQEKVVKGNRDEMNRIGGWDWTVGRISRAT